MSYGHFRAQTWVLQSLLIDGSHVFHRSCSFMTEMCISGMWCYISILGVDTVKIQQVVFTLLFLKWLKIHHGGLLWSKRLFYRVQWAGQTFPLPSQSDLQCCGWGLSKITFLRPWLQRHHLADCAHVSNKALAHHFQLLGQVSIFLGHSSSWQFEPMQQIKKKY